MATNEGRLSVARIRSIHYDAWKSRKLSEASDAAERLYWRLQPLCDDDGRAEDDPELIAPTVYPLRREVTGDDIDRLLTELEHLGLIVRYEVDGVRVFAVTRWHDYQSPRRPQSSKLPAPPDQDSPQHTVVAHSSVQVPTSTDNARPERRGEERRGTGGEGSGEGTRGATPRTPRASRRQQPVEDPPHVRPPDVQRCTHCGCLTHDCTCLITAAFAHADNPPAVVVGQAS